MPKLYAAILCVQLVTLYVLKPVLWFPGLGNIMAALDVAKAAIMNRGCLTVESLVSAIVCVP